MYGVFGRPNAPNVFTATRALRWVSTATALLSVGVCRGSRGELAIGCAIVDRFVGSVADHARAKTAVAELAVAAAGRVTELEVGVVVNAADDLDRGEMFLTVTGTSAEAGDDGEVGRGNRTSGLITPYRPRRSRPRRGRTRSAGRQALAAVLVSQIGRPIDDPRIVDARVALAPGRRIADVTAPVEALLRHELSTLAVLRERVLDGDLGVY